MRFARDYGVSGLACICAFALALALAAPRTHAGSGNAPAFVEDMTGRRVALNGRPRRILFSANVMPAFATLAGGVGRVAAATWLGRSGMDGALLEQIFPASRDIAFAGAGTSLDPERALLIAPDAIFGWAFQKSAIESAALPAFVAFATDGTLDADARLWDFMGQISGASAAAEALRARGDATLAAIASRLASETVARPRVLILVSNLQGMWIGPRIHSLTTRLALAGAENVATSARASLFNIEQIARIDPDVILISTNFANLVPADLYRQKQWRMLRATRERRVYLQPHFPAFAGPVFDPLLIQWLAETLHPETAPGQLRNLVRASYLDVWGYRIGEAEIDRVLNVVENSTSASHAPFLAQPAR
ncbi:periplasmic binding protein [Methylocella silvestris BL2]|uniref:Periplasmic binding protein n=1 Tax=Methylocella silvestris (strain DSM 15510 / CIP 108128 / LMG 27833 / NCIMB 13906 / BL2) TaxID=395965 RepID=B8ETL0_METSB|nr:ABC transporter substrate-binding protein [Methylocella silvestris]ACK52362.1 periplasmic binding protein [Methylocella silvestris BL2]